MTGAKMNWMRFVLSMALVAAWNFQESNAAVNIIFAKESSIKFIDIHNVSAQGVLVSGLSQARSLALYIRHGWMFWSEYGSPSSISRLHLSEGSIKEKILDDLGEVDGIAVEWETGLIYWTDYMYETIEVAKIDGTYRKTLIWQNMANPRAIVVDSRTGYMYWSERGWDFPRIERATLAGTERRILFDGYQSFYPQLLINSLVIDFNSNLLYWADANNDVIEHMNLDGSDRNTVTMFTSLNLYSFSLALHEDMLYASDLRSRSIERVNLTTGQHYRNMGWLGSERTYGIALNDSSREPQGMTNCTSNTECSHLCLLTPDGGMCACSNGYELLPDNKTCNASAPTTRRPIEGIEIRLVKGNLESFLEGRVEVRLSGSNEWGTVCDDHFDLRDAEVVCRMLNHSRAVRIFSPASVYGVVNDNVSIWLDNLKCRGDENSLMECRHRGWGINNCGHFEDVGVTCTNDSVVPTAPSPTMGPPANISVRLRGGTRDYNGRVEVLYNGTWGTICDNNFDIQDANVVCKMLGYKGAWSTECCGFYGLGSGLQIWMDNVDCSGNESSLSQCAHGGWGGHTDVCSHSNDVGVYCIPNPVVTPDQTIRLADGTSPNEGRVEIFLKTEHAGEQIGEWGTICDDQWDLKDAAVICRMLNYTGALAAPLSGAYGEGSGTIWLDSVNCMGNETSIENCPHGGLGNHDCSHFEDAGVICQVNESHLPAYESKKSLLIAEYKRSVLYHVDMETDPNRAVPLPIDKILGLTAVGFDPIDQKIYYGELGRSIIRRSYLNGTADETIINGVYFANRLAIDYINRNIYYTDSQRNKIDVAAVSGLHRTTLLLTTAPEGIALDLKNGHVYWSSNGFRPKIERADMDGKNRRVILELSIDSTPSGLIVQHMSNNQSRLYYTDRFGQEVYFIDLNSNQSRSFIANELIHPVDLTIQDNNLYVSDAGSGIAWDGGVYSTLLGGTGNVSKVIDLLNTPWEIDSYDLDNIYTPESPGCTDKCSHLCLNSPSGAHCACPVDMYLTNETSCAYHPLILHTECYFSEIYKAPLGGGYLFDVANTLPLKHASCPSAVASNAADKKVYWTDLTFKHIVRANLDGTDEEIIVENVEHSLGLAVDSYSGNIYFTDKGNKTVQVAKLDGSNRKVLIDTSPHEPVGLAIDSSRGYLYYSTWGDPPMIVRAEMDGSHVTPLVKFSPWSTQGPSALAIDVDDNLLFWVSDRDPSLQYIDLRYPNSEIVYHIAFSNYLHSPMGLALDAHYFYWTDGLLGNVIRASRSSDQTVDELIPFQYTPRGVDIYNPKDIQAPHPCVDICSHLCLPKPGGYKCACPVDDPSVCNETTNVTNAYGCSEDPSLYVSERHSIKCIDIKTYNHSHVEVKTLKTGLADAGAIDIDHRERMIFWSDHQQWTINRMSLVTGETEVIIRDNLGQVDGLAVEWESGLIYWTDYIFERIEVARIDGLYRRTLFYTNLYNPRGIAVDPKSGYMFWTDWGLFYPKIERADLSGENRKVVVDLALWYFVLNQLFPMSVVIDYEAERIYWMDAYDNYIESTDYDGGNWRTVHYVSQNIFPADLALNGDNLYWVDWNSQSVQWLNKSRPLLMRNFGHLSDFYLTGAVVSDQSRQPVASSMHRPPCRINNGGCSHLCLLAPSGKHKCACPNGIELERDGMTCKSNGTLPSTPPPPVPDVRVRLRGSNSSNEGRVEIYHQGKWGTICDDHWGFREATVICRMLNYSAAVYAIRYANTYFGSETNSSFPIWMDNVKCRGDEQSIAACRFNEWGYHDCSHFEDAGVVCYNESIPPTEGPTLAPGPHPELRVRLRSGTTSNQGRVELFLNGTWGTICDDYWGIDEANVICRMLGYSEGAWSTHCCGWYNGLTAPTQIWLDDVHCDGDEQSIAACRHGGWGSHNCYHSEDVGVVCKYTPPPPPDQTLRLIDGYRNGEGRVELFHDGHWGTVCDDFWDIKDAQVVCRQLGFDSAVVAHKFAIFGEGNGHIWLDNVHCVGNESSIESCPHNGWNDHNCQHYEDASVICRNGTLTLDGDDFLLVCEGGRRLCYYVPLQTQTPPNPVPLSIPLDSTPFGVAFDPVERRIYWTDAFGYINRAFLNDESKQVVVRGLSRPLGIEIDPVGRNIYFADENENSIKIAKLDGTHAVALVNVQSPQGITLDISSGYMYFSSVGSNPQILRADMDGKNKIVLANLSNIGQTIIDLVLDKPGNRLYFSDQSNNVIRYIDLDNLQVHTLLSGNSLHGPTGVTAINSTLYLTAQGDGSFAGTIFKANTSSGTKQMIADGFSNPHGIYAFNSRAPLISGPCENNGGCSQLCVINPGGQTCMCQAGMTVNEDKRTCTVKNVIMVADSYYDEIYLSTLDSSDTTIVPLPVQNLTYPVGVDFDPFNNRIYWTDYSLGTVKRSLIDGSNQETIRSGIARPYGIALDLVAENVYWISRLDKTIEVSKLDGSDWKVLVSDLGTSPDHIALDTSRGYMYWSEYGRIGGADMDGENQKVVAVLTYNYGSYDARGLAMDIQMNRIYFVSYWFEGLLYVDLNAGGKANGPVKVLFMDYSFDDDYFLSPRGLALDDQYVYWNEYWNEKVYRINKTGFDGDLAVVASGMFSPRGMAVVKGKPNASDPHPCLSTCSHLCLLKPGGYKCACPVKNPAICNESVHQTNFYGCSSNHSLYFSDQNSIKCIDLKSYNQTYVNMKTVKTELSDVGAVDIDRRERMIYWSDHAQWAISRMSLVTGYTEVIIRDNLGQVDGLAVEWESGLIYWTDYIFERIEVARVNGSHRKTLFTERVYNPRGIAVDPKSGYMFWTDWGLYYPKIERADLSGENRQVVVDLGLWYFVLYQLFPMSVVIDHGAERIYWMDAYDNYIDSTDYNGNNWRTVHYVSHNIFPADLALYGDNLYWVDWHSQSIQWFNKSRPLLLHNFGHLSDVFLTGAVVSDESRQPVAPPTNQPPCRINNGGCSHLCLVSPNGTYKCACPNGARELGPDGRNCNGNMTVPTTPIPVPDVRVRLRGSNSSNEGRVEIYHQGKWGTICDDHWGYREATVICRMLNYSAAVYAVGYAHFGQANSSFPIWMDSVKCRGDEKTIAACRHDGWGTHDCSHSEDAGVVCYNGSIPPTEVPTVAPGPHPELRVRLRSGSTSNEGRVELFLNGTWGTICDDYWGIDEANVICRMLGYSEGAWSTHCCGWYDSSSAPSQIWLDDVECVGDEQSIAACRHGGWGRHNCYHSEDVGVVCKYTPPPPPDKTLRLAGGYRRGEGRVEIFRDGHWGTVCDDFWDFKDAQVVCRSLGHERALLAPQFAAFGEGNGHIWLDNVHCVGNESSIEDCPHNGWGNNDCSHSEDASVICSNETVQIGAGDFLLSCEGGRKVCYYMSLEQPTPLNPLPLSIPLTISPFGVAYDSVEERIYWADADGNIRRAFLNDTTSQVVIKGISRPMGLEIDSIGRNIYVADQNENNIKVLTLDGSYETVIVDVDSPQGIALNSYSGLMYFASVGWNPQILQAEMDGKNKIVLANLSSIGQTIIDLVLDMPGLRLFFSDQSNNVIRYIDLISLEVHTLLSGSGLHGPTGLAMLNDTLYWTAHQDGGMYDGFIFEADVTNRTVRMIADGFNKPAGLYAYNSRGPKTPVQTACQKNNGECSHMCVVRPGGRTCFCQAGMKITEDGKTCTVADALFVTDSYDNKVYISSLSPDDTTIVPLQLKNLSFPLGVDFDPFEDRVYWTDYHHGFVERAFVDGRNQEIVHMGLSQPSGIALDLVGGNVYWISTGNLTVEVSKLDGSFRKLLVSNLSSYAIDIALDTMRGYMYWTSYGIIEGADMDGSNRRNITFLRGSFGHHDALGLALDVQMNRLYFVSYSLSGLFYIDLDSAGSSYIPQSLLQSFFYFYEPHGVALDDQFVYWNEYFEEKVFRMNKTVAGNIETVAAGIFSPYGLAVKKGTPTRNTGHPCMNANGYCTHLCLLSPSESGYQCACPDIGDGRECFTIPKPPTTTTTAPTTIAPTTVFIDYCEGEPCANGAGCESSNGLYICTCVGYFGGVNCTIALDEENVVEVTFEGVTLDEFNLTAFIQAMVDALNQQCSDDPASCPISVESIVKREVSPNGPFTTDDIYITSPPEEVDGGVSLEYAVVKTTADGRQVPLPSESLAEVTSAKAAEIGKKLGATGVAAKPKPLTTTPTSEAQTGGTNGGMIAGVIVAVLLLVIIAAVAVWYFRVKRTRSTNIPYKKENDEEAPTGSIRRTAAFENPGYDSTGGLDIGSGGNYDDIAAVTFSPFEDFPDHTAATNQLYSAIGMTRISSSQDVSQNAEGGELAVKKITSDEKATQDHDAGALPKKEPLENEKAEQPHYATITINKNEESEENEPRYLTVPPSGREFANSEQVKVDLQENAENSNSENGQTVLVLDANYNQDEDPEV